MDGSPWKAGLDLNEVLRYPSFACCRGNAEEIVSSLQELEAMQDGTEELRKRVLVGDAVLRKAGTKFVDGLEQLQDLRRVESAVAASFRVRPLDLPSRSACHATYFNALLRIGSLRVQQQSVAYRFAIWAACCSIPMLAVPR